MRSENPILALLLLTLILTATACADNAGSSTAKGRQGGKPPVAFPVETEKIESRRVEYQVTAVGSVEAFETVQVTARVAGVIERVHFSEGETVKADKILAEIEPDRFRLAVESARAVLDKAEAAKVDAEAALARREAVNEKNPGLIIGEEIETFRTRVQTASAELSQARAALEIAELNLRDAFTKAPVVGIIQTRTVQTGEYVQPGKVLATLIRREPLLLRFRVPEQDSAALRPGMSARFTVRGSQRVYSAVLTHVAGSADPASRMVAVTGEVNDPNRKELRPGTFAEVRIPLEVTAETPVIPQTAIRPSEKGFLAFVVEEGIAKERVLTLGMRTAEGRVEVRSGVQPGEVLVIRGAEALREGAQVRIAEKEETPSGGPTSTPEQGGGTPADPNRGGEQR
ncbi:efflux RND transporter periplasmic adaptor subunit [Candidatus Manganitrophus noduliformans]|uniref:efflux RND transporter periplasmic adaptor subunit n=1 Tax=Candidatus Manganitrophus noduliformans TaxID=2606439 RepID=UPI00143B5225|nr:efflux RND transporter periplasmic adaptor subunit [Candidatus Manganitrophus noduliformans]